MRVSLAYITLQDNKKGFLLEWRVCRPPAAVPSSEEGSAKPRGENPPEIKFRLSLSRYGKAERKFFEKNLDLSKICDIICIAQLNIGELCNGSTTDSDSVCWGSNPYSPAKKKALILVIGAFFFVCIFVGIRTRRERKRKKTVRWTVFADVGKPLAAR